MVEVPFLSDLIYAKYCDVLSVINIGHLFHILELEIFNILTLCGVSTERVNGYVPYIYRICGRKKY